MILYDAFFRKYGVRRAMQLQSPPMAPMAQFTFPYLSILHYTSDSNLDPYPQANDWIFHEYHNPIMLESVTSLGKMLGHPVPIPGTQNLMRAVYNKVKRFRQLRQIAPYENARNTLLVMNYGLLNQMYRYPRNQFSLYYKWTNIQAAVWRKVAELAQESNRQQYLFVKLPNLLPAPYQLNQAQENFTAGLLKVFNNSASFMLLDIWKWLGERREESLIHQVPEDKLNHVNLVFQEAGRFTILNLGELNSWRLHKSEQNAEVGIPFRQLQNRFLHFCMSLSEAESVASDAPEADDPDAANASSIVAQVSQTNSSLPNKVNQTVEIVDYEEEGDNDGSNLDDGHDATINPDDGHSERLDLTDAELSKIERDLSELERIARRMEEMREDSAREAEAVAQRLHEHEFHDNQDQTLHPAQVETPVAQYEYNRSVKHAISLENVIDEIIPPHDTPEDGVKNLVERLSSQGLISAAEQRRYLEQAVRYQKIQAPLDNHGQTLEEFRHVTPEMVAIVESPSIPNIETVPDKSMLKSSLLDFDNKYTKHVMQRDVANMVLSLQNAGLCITDYEVEFEDSLLGSSYNYTVRINPVSGAPSTFRFKLPHVEEDGTYMANGSKYRLRKQRGDLPIRKTADDTVTITSYYGKLMVTRSSKKVDDFGYWLRSKMVLKALDRSDMSIYDAHQINVFHPHHNVPKLYSDIAKGFSTFSVVSQVPIDGVENVKLHFVFDSERRKEIFDKDVLLHLETKGGIICGSDEHHSKYVVMDQDSRLWMVGSNVSTELPSMTDILGLDLIRAPIDHTEMKVMGLKVPLIILLGYYIGLEKLLGILRVHQRLVPVGKRLLLTQTEYAIRFEDVSLILDRRDRFATMLLAGLASMEKYLRQYSIYDFNRKGVYLNLIENLGGSVRQIREIDLLNQLFIDPITKELLTEMHEPTQFVMLLLRANEMLLDNSHPHEFDPAFMRIKGYERLAGEAYTQMVRAIRIHSGHPGRNKQPIELHPYAVWQGISEDSSKNQTSDTNPIQALKEAEAVTYAGNGGRNSRTMVKHTRESHENDVGTISEGTVDSGDVGINIFTSADPQFQSLRGISRRWKNQEESGVTSVISTSFLNAPAADLDDPKRVNFIQIQNAHMLACSGYHAPPLRTGYEQVIPHRTGDLYATTAKQAGTVLSVSQHGIVVQYEDGTKKAVELGIRYGAASGLTIPHEVVANPTLKAGDSIKVGDVIAYNAGFFDWDPLNPGQVIMKSGMTVRVALMEHPMTLEDSCMITQELADKFNTLIAQPRTIILDFKQSVSHLVRVGDAVTSDTILCVIEDAVSANQSLFSQTSLDTLRSLAAQTPVAKYPGHIERIEVYYHGETEDMSDSLRELVKVSDAQLAKRYKAMGKPAKTGQVDEGFRNEGNPLLPDTLAIRIYILNEVSAGVGDKGVFGNQMKTVIGKVITDEIRTESGRKIDAIFGPTSVDARIVGSFDAIGTTIPLQREMGKRAADAYFGRKR